jgi:hypothetical protein
MPISNSGGNIPPGQKLTGGRSRRHRTRRNSRTRKNKKRTNLKRG